MADPAPIFIVGAPRSGTSLLQHIIRCAPGFVSPAKESQDVWHPHVHPSLNNWDFEGTTAQRLARVDTAAIRDSLYSQAVSANTWRLLRKSGIYRSRSLMRMARVAGTPLIKAANQLRGGNGGGASAPRFVDKSVHAGLWLDLVLAALPNCKVLHITRSPETVLPSMATAWAEPERFGTYDLPENFPRRWCFGLFEGWRELADAPVETICAHQWTRINAAILEGRPALLAQGGYQQIRLEALTKSPHTEVPRLLDYIGVEDNAYWASLREGLPRINGAGGGDEHPRASLSAFPERVYGEVARELGY